MTTPSVPDRNPPAFSFYPADFLVGTATFSLEECGAYIRLICYQWDHGCVPDDSTERARLLNCSLKRSDGLWARLRAKFQQGADGEWRNARLEKERAKQAARRDGLATAGAKGADARWHGKANSQAIARSSQPPAIETDGLSSSSSSSSSEDHSLKSASDRARTEGQRRAQAFMDYYVEKHQQVFGIAYFGTNSDWVTALRLVDKFSDQDLRDATLVWFGQDDDFARKGTRTVPKFGSRVTACVELARKVAS